MRDTLSHAARPTALTNASSTVAAMARNRRYGAPLRSDGRTTAAARSVRTDVSGQLPAKNCSMAANAAAGNRPPVTFAVFLGDDFAEMARNQVTNLADRRIRTVTFTCRR